VLTVTSTPSGADVFVDGARVGVTPMHETADSGLAAPSSTGVLTVTSTPSGADVFVDDARVGVTPITVSVPTGKRSVRVAGASGEERTRDALVDVEPSTLAFDLGKKANVEARGADAPEQSGVIGLQKDPWQFIPFIYAAFDAVSYAGQGVSEYRRTNGTGLDAGFYLQRLRPGFRGTILDKISYYALLELGQANSSSPNQTFSFSGGVVDAWAAYVFRNELAIQFGQMALPFGLENQRIGPAFDMFEPSNTAFFSTNGLRDVGLMVNGLPGPFVYHVGVFNGEGSRRAPVDSQLDVVGRAAVRLNRRGENRAQFGISGRRGGSDPRSTFSDSPLIGLTTAKGYQFWPGSYNVNAPPGPSAIGNAVNAPVAVAVLPAGPESAVGADAILQFGDFDLQAEGAYVNLGRREAIRTELDAENTLRSGTLSGFSYYVTAHYWITKPTPVMRALRYEPISLMISRTRQTPPEAFSFKPSVAVALRWEQMLLNYDSTARSDPGVPRGQLDQNSTDIKMNASHLGLSAWFTSRFRAQLEWAVYNFPSQEVAPGRYDNQALAPGAVPRGDRGTRPKADLPPDVSFGDPTYFVPPAHNARFLHEIMARVQLNFQ
jgi:hypothetical protein